MTENAVKNNNVYNVCFIKSEKSYLPEAFAYFNYLSDRGISSIICDNENEALHINAQVYYRFGGFLYKKIKSGIPEIHEYHTASTGVFPKLKNLLKSKIGFRPSYLSFLNTNVQSQFSFPKSIPLFYRDMGAEEMLMIQRDEVVTKKYDICYFGSISNRTGLVNEIFKIASEGFDVVIGGYASEQDVLKFNEYSNLNYVGFCSRDEIREYMLLSKFGLNYIPDEYPFTLQTSTKLIEYLVAGMPIVSNKYLWIDEHSRKHGYKYITIDKFKYGEAIDDYERDEFILPKEKAKEFVWDSILNKCGFIDVISKVIESSK